MQALFSWEPIPLKVWAITPAVQTTFCPPTAIATQALQPAGIVAMQQRVTEILHNREILQNLLKILPIAEQVFSSDGNYLLVKFKDGQKVFNALWDQGIILRNQHKALMLENCIRITIGTAEENQRVIDALQQIQ